MLWHINESSLRQQWIKDADPILAREAPHCHSPMILVRLCEDTCVSLCILDFKIKEGYD